MTPFRLRPARADDYAVLASWIGDGDGCERWAGPGLAYPFHADDLPRLLGATADNAFCLIRDGDRGGDEGDDPAVAGFGQIMTPPPDRAHLARIIVDPAARGRGLGTMLCRLLFDHAAHARNFLDARRYTLRVYPDNAAAIKLYSALGFVAVEVNPDNGVILMEMPRS